MRGSDVGVEAIGLGEMERILSWRDVCGDPGIKPTGGRGWSLSARLSQKAVSSSKER